MEYVIMFLVNVAANVAAWLLCRSIDRHTR